MKILILNPHIDAEHGVVRTLRESGAALLFPANAEEAFQLLQFHGTSVDLALIHREGGPGQDPEAGLGLIGRIKGDPTQADLPIILTTEQWSDSQCAQHQQTPLGANAYLSWPFAPARLVEAIHGVLGESAPAVAAPSIKPPPAPKGESSLGLVLEEASSESGSPESNAFSFEAPEFEASRSDTGSIVFQKSEPSVGQAPATETPPEIVIAGESDGPPAIQENPSIPTADTEVEAPLEEQGGVELGLGLPLTPPPVVEASPAPVETTLDPEAEQEMPYLFQKSVAPENEPVVGQGLAALGFTQPVGDAVVPGGAAQSPDNETLKKYLLLREQDVAVLSNQLKSARDQITDLEMQLRVERAKSVELSHLTNEQKQKIEQFDEGKDQMVASLQSEINELRFQLKAKTDKSRVLETQVREATDEIEKLKERVRLDIRKIRVREKELENRLEVVKKDSEALIGARESKIVELKRKLDLLEFNMDLLQDQHAREKANSTKLRERLGKVAQAVRVAGGLLDSQAKPESGTMDPGADPDLKSGNDNREAS